MKFNQLMVLFSSELFVKSGGQCMRHIPEHASLLYPFVKTSSSAACAPWASRSAYKCSNIHCEISVVFFCIVHSSILLTMQYFSGPWVVRCRQKNLGMYGYKRIGGRPTQLNQQSLRILSKNQRPSGFQEK